MVRGARNRRNKDDESERLRDGEKVLTSRRLLVASFHRPSSSKNGGTEFANVSVRLI